jgi:S1-C subfamily serine protease
VPAPSPRPLQPGGGARPVRHLISLVAVQKARTSVAHITTLTRAPAGFLQLDPGAIRPGTGSGFLWDEAGHIVTVKVTLSDQRTNTAKLVGVDPNNDVAVLKVPSGAVGANTPIAVGTSHDLLVGQKVFAIGNPFGLDQTLTGVAPCTPGILHAVRAALCMHSDAVRLRSMWHSTQHACKVK